MANYLTQRRAEALARMVAQRAPIAAAQQRVAPLAQSPQGLLGYLPNAPLAVPAALGLTR